MEEDRAPRIRRIVAPLAEFSRQEAAGGIVLLAATVIALAWANSSASDAYIRLWQTPITVGQGPLAITVDLQQWINDGAMTLFFFVAGLEIKRELIVGELSERRTAALPVAAAVGGVILPAVLYLAITVGSPAIEGWGIPMATDIAFAVGVLALVGRRVPPSARLLLLSVAIIDDIIAVVVIAVAHGAGLSWGWLAAAIGGLGAMVLMRAAGVSTITAYAALGVFVWYTGFHSGIHATIFGVVLGLMTPARPVDGRDVLGWLERSLHPVSAFLVVPLFALANVGVDLRGGLLGQAFGSRVTWAVIIGFVVGKPLGVSGAVFLARRTGIGALPPDMTPRLVWGIGALSGIGFTVALFITDLSFDDPVLAGNARVGILTASAAAAIIGALTVHRLTRVPGHATRSTPAGGGSQPIGSGTPGSPDSG
jgi:Na+:H+ antiporter, NhaA family